MRKSTARLALAALAAPLCLPIMAAHASGPDNNQCTGATLSKTGITGAICVSTPVTTPANDDNGTWSFGWTNVRGNLCSPGAGNAGPDVLTITSATQTPPVGHTPETFHAGTIPAKGVVLQNAATNVLAGTFVYTANESVAGGGTVTELHLVGFSGPCTAGGASVFIGDLLPPSASVGEGCRFAAAADPTGVVNQTLTTKTGPVISGPWIDVTATTTNTICTFYKNLGAATLPIAANRIAGPITSGFIPGMVGVLASTVTYKSKATDTVFVCSQEQWKDPLNMTTQTFSPLPCAKAS